MFGKKSEKPKVGQTFSTTSDVDVSKLKKKSDEIGKKLTVILRSNSILACGEYKANTEYELPEAEAQRLIALKGFEQV